MTTHSNTEKNVLMFVAGLVAGATLTALYTPKKGEDLRRNMKQKLNDIHDNAQTKAHDVRDSVSDKVRGARQRIQNMKQELQSNINNEEDS